MPVTPKRAADSCMRRSKVALKLAQSLQSKGIRYTDLQRMAIVMAVAGVDTFMHKLVMSQLVENREVGLPNALKKFEIPFGEIASLADNTLTARRKNRKSRPWVQVRSALERALLERTFQSSRGIEDAMSLAGVKGYWPKISAELGESTTTIKQRLDSIVHRRNQIVHEGDLVRSERPRKVKLNHLDFQETTDSIAWIERLLEALEKATT